jgi:hypothetical protein
MSYYQREDYIEDIPIKVLVALGKENEQKEKFGTVAGKEMRRPT